MQSQVCTWSYGLAKLQESQLWEFRDSHLGVQGQKSIWMRALRRGAEYYIIWGKVVASPRFGPWWVLWVQGRPWLILTPKVLWQNTNKLVGLSCAGSCGWIVCLSFFLIPSRSSSMPLYPSKCLEPGKVPRLLALQLFTL